MSHFFLSFLAPSSSERPSSGPPSSPKSSDEVRSDPPSCPAKSTLPNPPSPVRSDPSPPMLPLSPESPTKKAAPCTDDTEAWFQEREKEIEQDVQEAIGNIGANGGRSDGYTERKAAALKKGNANYGKNKEKIANKKKFAAAKTKTLEIAIQKWKENKARSTQSRDTVAVMDTDAKNDGLKRKVDKLCQETDSAHEKTQHTLKRNKPKPSESSVELENPLSRFFSLGKK